MPKKYLIPVIIVALIILGLLFYIFNMHTDVKTNKTKTEIKKVKKQIDSASVKRKYDITDFTNRADNDAKTSTKILNSIKHEKIIVRDTSYAAMCKYIEDYRPN